MGRIMIFSYMSERKSLFTSNLVYNIYDESIKSNFGSGQTSSIIQDFSDVVKNKPIYYRLGISLVIRGRGIPLYIFYIEGEEDINGSWRIIVRNTPNPK